MGMLISQIGNGPVQAPRCKRALKGLPPEQHRENVPWREGLRTHHGDPGRHPARADPTGQVRWPRVAGDTLTALMHKLRQKPPKKATLESGVVPLIPKPPLGRSSACSAAQKQ